MGSPSSGLSTPIRCRSVLKSVHILYSWPRTKKRIGNRFDSSAPYLGAKVTGSRNCSMPYT